MPKKPPAPSAGRRLRARSLTAAISGSALLVSGLTMPAIATAAPADTADTVFVNGRVMEFTDDGSDATFAQALAVQDGEIAFIGSDSDARARIGDDTQVYDLGGRLMMPGLGDGHLHGARAVDCDLDYEGGTIDTVLGKIKACLESPEQAAHLDSNYVLDVQNFMGEGMIPSDARLDRTVLDRLSADPADDPFGTGTMRPIVVRHMDSHKSYTNSRAIENAGITADTDPGAGYIGIGADGLPNGQFADFSGDWGDRTPRDPDISYQLLEQNIAYANSLGITEILRPGGSQADAERAKRLADEGKLTVRLNQALSASAVRGEADPSSFIDGLNNVRAGFDGYSSPASPGDLTVDTVKIFCDGVPEYPGQTAAMEVPYRKNIGTAENPQWVDGDARGEEPSCEDATPGFSALDDAEWNIHVHSLGDRSTRVTLDNFEAALANHDWDRRHAITHLEFVNQSDIPRFQQLGVLASMSLQWAQRDAWSTHGIEGFVDDALLPRLYPARELLDADAVIAAGSDWPVTNLMPWRQIQTAVTRTGPENPARAIYPGPLAPDQAIGLVEAVRASTWGVAYQLHNEDRTGTLEVGKLADLIVTDRDIFSIDVHTIADTRVFMTMLGGTIVYEAEDSPLEPTLGPGEGGSDADAGSSEADADSSGTDASAASNGADASAGGTSASSGGTNATASGADASSNATGGTGAEATGAKNPLAQTGSGSSIPLILIGGGALLAGAVGLLVAARRRRRDTV